MSTVVEETTRLAATGPAGRLMASAAGGLADHHARLGPVPWRGAGELLADVEEAGLTGRGGAAFPAWRKHLAVSSGRRPVVVANGAEGEPASAKDVTLLHRAPHLVLDGLQLAAEAVGAEEVHAYVSQRAVEPVRRALGERARLGWDRRPVRLHQAPDTFVSGQESAVVAAIEGRPALPRSVPPLVVERGVHGRPTLVHNVETLAHLGLLARRGPEWFRRSGTREEPGTFLATVSGAVPATAVVEAAYGVPLRHVVDLAGGTTGPVGAVLVGGYHGAWLPPAALDQPMSRAGLAAYDATPGAGVVVVLPSGRCGLAAAADVMGYLAGQTAGQCGPCLNGLPALAVATRRLADAPRTGRPADPALLRQVEWLTGLVTGRGACHHPDGSVRMLRTALRTFADEVQAHLAGACTARPAPEEDR